MNSTYKSKVPSSSPINRGTRCKHGDHHRPRNKDNHELSNVQGQLDILEMMRIELHRGVSLLGLSCSREVSGDFNCVIVVLV